MDLPKSVKNQAANGGAKLQLRSGFGLRCVYTAPAPKATSGASGAPRALALMSPGLGRSRSAPKGCVGPILAPSDASGASCPIKCWHVPDGQGAPCFRCRLSTLSIFSQSLPCFHLMASPQPSTCSLQAGLQPAQMGSQPRVSESLAPAGASRSPPLHHIESRPSSWLVGTRQSPARLLTPSIAAVRPRCLWS